MTVEIKFKPPLFSGGNFAPPADAAYDLGSETLGWRNIYLRNENQSVLYGDAAVQGALTVKQLSNPAAPTITNVGTAGATTYTYKVTATVAGLETAASAAGSTATGNAALSGSNYNVITWVAISGATGYKVYRTVGGATQGLINTIATGLTLSLNDTGLAGGGETPPTANTTGLLAVAGGLTRYTAGAAITAAQYEVGRDADGTNQLHFNAPTGAGFEWSINDVGQMFLTPNLLVVGTGAGNPVVRIDSVASGSGSLQYRLGGVTLGSFDYRGDLTPIAWEVFVNGQGAGNRVLGITAAAVAKFGPDRTVRATTEGTNHIDIFDGTAPAGTLTNGISLYSTAGELRVMDAAGNATLLSPHDKDGYWIFDSRDSITGHRLRIHIERLVRQLEKMYGWGFLEEFKE